MKNMDNLHDRLLKNDVKAHRSLSKLFNYVLGDIDNVSICNVSLWTRGSYEGWSVKATLSTKTRDKVIIYEVNVDDPNSGIDQFTGKPLVQVLQVGGIVTKVSAKSIDYVKTVCEIYDKVTDEFENDKSEFYSIVENWLKNYKEIKSLI